MADLFLEQTGVRNEYVAMRESLKSALSQRKNRVYSREEVGNEREDFRGEFSRLIRAESQRYTQAVSDADHYAAIRRISDTLSAKFTPILKDGRLRYGTSQKAFNLYLKYLWRLGKIVTPPHCPVDRQVLAAGGIDGKWTASDSEKEYIYWINSLRWKAKPLCLAEWEYQIWSPETDKSKATPCR